MTSDHMAAHMHEATRNAAGWHNALGMLDDACQLLAHNFESVSDSACRIIHCSICAVCKDAILACRYVMRSRSKEVDVTLKLVVRLLFHSCLVAANSFLLLKDSYTPAF